MGILEDVGSVLDARAIARREPCSTLRYLGDDLAPSIGADPLPDVSRMPKRLAAKVKKSCLAVQLRLPFTRLRDASFALARKRAKSTSSIT